MSEYVISAALAVSVPLASYLLIKREISDDKLANKVATLIENLANDAETQQKLYIIGGVLGQGLAQGSGIGKLIGGRGGKLNIKDIIMQVVAGYAQSKLPNMFGQGEQPQNTPSEASQNLNIT